MVTLSAGRLTRADTDVSVACVTLDQLLATGRFPVPDLIKVDVEGAESQVLRGSQKLLREHAAIWFVALHSTDEKSSCMRLLATAGYSVSSLSGESCELLSPDAVPDEIIATRVPLHDSQ